MNQSKVIGLTGGIASGKSTVSKYLMEKGYPIVDADKISRQVVEPGQKGLMAIVEHFGESILEDHRLNRKKLRQIIFSDDDARLHLNNILHPIIHEAIEEAFKNIEAPIIIFDVPLLLENKLEYMVDCIWVVACKKELQIQRIMTRDGSTYEEALSIINKQMPLSEKVKKADLVILNEDDLNTLYKQIDQALEGLC